MDIESPDCILIKSGSENHQRHIIALQLTYNIKTIYTRHLYIKKNQIRIKLRNSLQCFATIFTLTNNIHVFMFVETYLQATTCQCLIINN